MNSVCAPIERSLDGDKLTWRLVCKGQLDMELTGEFTFDSPHHYTATVQTKAAMAGMHDGRFAEYARRPVGVRVPAIGNAMATCGVPIACMMHSHFALDA